MLTFTGDHFSEMLLHIGGRCRNSPNVTECDEMYSMCSVMHMIVYVCIKYMVYTGVAVISMLLTGL